MSNLQSNLVKVFPSALRTEYPSGKFTSEENITGITRSNNDRDSYIINLTESDGKVSGDIVIHGYYFSFSELDKPSGNLFAYITLDASNRLVSASGAAVLDSEDKYFKALTFSSEEPSSDNYNLQLYSKGNICKDSYIRVNSGRISIEGSSPTINLTDKLSSIDTSITDIDNKKQPVINDKNKLDIKYLDGGPLDVGLGGTGSTTLESLTVGNATNATNAINATQLVKNSTAIKEGDLSHSVYFDEGKPKIGRGIYVQNTAPTDAKTGDIWIDVEL